MSSRVPSLFCLTFVMTPVTYTGGTSEVSRFSQTSYDFTKTTVQDFYQTVGRKISTLFKTFWGPIINCTLPLFRKRLQWTHRVEQKLET